MAVKWPVVPVSDEDWAVYSEAVEAAEGVGFSADIAVAGYDDCRIGAGFWGCGAVTLVCLGDASGNDDSTVAAKVNGADWDV